MPQQLPRIKLKSSPLSLVLVQARFPSLIDFEAKQDLLRRPLEKLGYVVFRPGQESVVRFVSGKPESVEFSRWDFLDKSLAWNVVVTKEYLLLMTTQYDVFEDFQQRWANVLEAAKSLEIPIVERLGLRYLDVIEPGSQESVADYLDSSFSGPSLKWDDALELTGHHVVSEIKSKTGKLVIRRYPKGGKGSLPSDLHAPHIRARSVKADAAFLDFDHFTEEIQDFEVDSLVRKTGELHHNTDLAFRNIITPHAKAVWGWEELT